MLRLTYVAGEEGFDFFLWRTPAGKLCIEVSSQSKIAFISEELCIGCGIRVKVSAKFSGVFQLSNSIFSQFRAFMLAKQY